MWPRMSSSPRGVAAPPPGAGSRRRAEQTALENKFAGTVQFHSTRTVRNAAGDLVVMNRNGALSMVDEKGRKKETYHVIYGARLKVHEGQQVAPGTTLAEWDPFTSVILSEAAGRVVVKDVIDGVTMQEEVDEVTGLAQRVIVEHGKEELQPRVSVKDEKGVTVFRTLLPVGGHLLGPGRRPSSPRLTGESGLPAWPRGCRRSSSRQRMGRPRSI